MAHAHGGRPCEWPTKKACEAARRAELGRCVELVAKDKSGQTSCRNWAVERVNDRPVCGQHYESILTREREAAARAAKKAQLDAAIDAFIARAPRRQAATYTWHALQAIRSDMKVAEVRQ